MGIFGINKALESIQREINNSEYCFTKNELRSNASTVFIVFENIMKELLHIYSFLLHGASYEDKLYKNKKMMLGKVISCCENLNEDLEKLNKIKENIGRDYLIFNKYSDENLKKSREISRVRGIIFHDDIQDIKDLDEYKQKIYDSMNLCKAVLQNFKDNNIFPRLLEVKSITQDNQVLIINFIDEIGSTVPANLTSKNKYISLNNQVYLFRGKIDDKIIPTKTKIDYLNNNYIEQNYLELDNKDEDIEGVETFYLEISDRRDRIPLQKEKKFIGRHLESDIIFKEKSISRRQCIIESIDQSIYIYDLDSTFGTRINGEKIEAYKKYELHENDEITIGVKEESRTIFFRK